MIEQFEPTQIEERFIGVLHELGRDLISIYQTSSGIYTAMSIMAKYTRAHQKLSPYSFAAPPDVPFIRRHGFVILAEFWKKSSQVVVMPWSTRIGPISYSSLHEALLILRQTGAYCLVTTPILEPRPVRDGLSEQNEVKFFTEADMVLGAALFDQYKE